MTKLGCCLLSIWFAGAAFLLSAEAAADTGDPSRIYVGILTGAGFANKGLGTHLVSGLHGGVKALPWLDTGVYGTFQPLAAASEANLASATSISAELTTLAFEANAYPFGNRNLYLGAKVGMGIVTAGSSVFYGYNSSYNWETGVKFAVGPAAGFLIRLAPELLVGVQGNYITLPFAETYLSSGNVLANVVWAM